MSLQAPKEQSSYEAINMITEQIKDLRKRIATEFDAYEPRIAHYEKKNQKMQNNLTWEDFECFMKDWEEKLKEIKQQFQKEQKYSELFQQLENYKVKKEMHEEILLSIYLERLVNKEEFLIYEYNKQWLKARKILDLKFKIKSVSKFSDMKKIITDFEYEQYCQKYAPKEVE